LWNVSWFLTTRCALIFTTLCVPVEVPAFRTIHLIFRVPYAVIKVIRIGLVLTRTRWWRRRRGRRSRFTSANYAGASFHIKVMTLSTVPS
jgi:hypothetical protein